MDTTKHEVKPKQVIILRKLILPTIGTWWNSIVFKIEFHQVPTVGSIIFFFFNASTVCLTVLLKKLRKKKALTSQHLWFNRECVKKGLVPKYVCVNFKTNSERSVSAKKETQESWVEYEIKKWVSIRDRVCQHLKVIHSELTFRLHPLLFDTLEMDIREYVTEFIHNKYFKQFKKLDNLLIKHKPRNLAKSTNNIHKKFFNRVQ